MAAALLTQHKFSFDRPTLGIFASLIKQADGDGNTCDAMPFRAEHAKYQTLIDQLVVYGFIIHDMSDNSYRLYTPFLRVLDDVFVCILLDDLNALLNGLRALDCNDLHRGSGIEQLTEETGLNADRIAAIHNYLYWLGLIAAPLGVDQPFARVIVMTDFACRFTTVESCMDHLLNIFDVSVNTPHGKAWATPFTGLSYSTPLLELVRQTVDDYFVSREPSDYPDRAVLTETLCTKLIDGKPVSRQLAEAIDEIVRPPDSA